MSQVEHIAPGSAQRDNDIDSHWPLALQQPVGHEVALHLQVPLPPVSSQYWPGSHGRSDPHTQPDGAQRFVSGRVAQFWQTTPAVPHCSDVATWQAPLKQQPDGQFDGSQPVQVYPSHSPPSAQV